MYTSVFDKLIGCTIGPNSFLCETVQFSHGAVNCDYIVTKSINFANWLKMYSQWYTH